MYTARWLKGHSALIVRTVCGSSKYGSLKVNEWLQPRNGSPHKAVLWEIFTSRSSYALGEADVQREEMDEKHRWVVAGYGSKRPYKDRRDNVGKDHLPAGARSNLRRPVEIGKTEVVRRIVVWRMSQEER